MVKGDHGQSDETCWVGGGGHLGLKKCAGQSKTPKKGLLTRNPAETTKTS